MFTIFVSNYSVIYVIFNSRYYKIQLCMYNMHVKRGSETDEKVCRIFFGPNAIFRRPHCACAHLSATSVIGRGYHLFWCH